MLEKPTREAFETALANIASRQRELSEEDEDLFRSVVVLYRSDKAFATLVNLLTHSFTAAVTIGDMDLLEPMHKALTFQSEMFGALANAYLNKK